MAQAFANLQGFATQTPDDAFRAGLRKLGPKINIPEVFLTRKAKNIHIYLEILIYLLYINIYVAIYVFPEEIHTHF